MNDKKAISMSNVSGLAGIELLINQMNAGDSIAITCGDNWGVDISFDGCVYKCEFGDEYKTRDECYSNKYELMWDVAVTNEWGGI